jgi:hypothetical protein
MSTLSILMPLRSTDDLQPETARALRLHTPEHRLFQVAGLPVDQARNTLAQKVLALPNPPDVVLWIDSDAFWGAGAIEALLATMEAYPSYAMICGLFSKRMAGCAATALRKAGDGASALRPTTPEQKAIGNCIFGDVVPIETTGMHFTAVRIDALRSVSPGAFNVRDGLAEDQSFCKRLRGAGYESACATGIVIAHLEAKTGLAYTVGRHPYIVADGVARNIEEQDFPRLQSLGMKIVPTGKGSTLQFGAEIGRHYGAEVDIAIMTAMEIEKRSQRRVIRGL